MSEASKALKIGVPKESMPGERRVALVPEVVARFKKKGFLVLIEAGAGRAAGFPDALYKKKGAELVTREAVFKDADIIAQVNGPGVNTEKGAEDVALLRPGQVLIGMADPLGNPQMAATLAEKQITSFGLELVPRITRAQSMDILSSNATIAGYKAVLTAASLLPKMFPMLMTAAGTVKPAKVFIIGAGVAGLQAIATAKRLGAIVTGYDIRPAVREQVESLGARFADLGLETGQSETKGGYAKKMDDDFYKRQQQAMLKIVAEHDVVITTAAIPGRKSPVLVTEPMVEAMREGSVIVDLAAERGGNCACTVGGETVVSHGVTITGPLNVVATVPFHASQMYARNLTTFLLHIAKDGKLDFDLEDEITRDTLMSQNGKVTNERLRGLLGLEEDAAEAKGKGAEAEGSEDAKEQNEAAKSDAKSEAKKDAADDAEKDAEGAESADSDKETKSEDVTAAKG